MRLRKPSLSKHRLLTAYLAGVVLVAQAGCESPAPITMPAPDYDAKSKEQVSEGLAVGVPVLPPTQRSTLPSPETPVSAISPAATATSSKPVPRPDPATVSPEAIADREVLVAFYYATGREQWVESKNWLTDLPLAEWHGVSTDKLGRVIELELQSRSNVTPSNNLTGHIPPELAKLSELRKLDLEFNYLTGHIPAELGSLSDLREMKLGHNELFGEIPHSLANLKDLEQINFGSSWNPWAFCASHEIQHWLKRVWDVSDLHQLQTCPEPELKETLDAIYRSTGGEKWTYNFGWLTYQPIRDWFGIETDDKGNVIGLDLAENDLSGPVPSELGNLQIGFLNLSGNDLTGPVPTVVLTSVGEIALMGNLDLCIPASARDLYEQEGRKYDELLPAVSNCPW